MQYARMKRSTITLTDELAGALEREARRRRLSVSQITREALRDDGDLRCRGRHGEECAWAPADAL
jgi:hypothetical protein